MASKWKVTCDLCSGKGVVAREEGKDSNGNTDEKSVIVAFPALCPKCNGSGMMSDSGPSE